MSARSLSTDTSAERPWTVYGTYCDEEFADGGISEGDFAGVFYAPTPEDAECLAFEDEPWLDAQSVTVEPGTAHGVPSLIADSQLQQRTNAPELAL
jgi:hypothetical protein